jgi:hypothetical protein
VFPGVVRAALAAGAIRIAVIFLVLGVGVVLHESVQKRLLGMNSSGQEIASRK